MEEFLVRDLAALDDWIIDCCCSLSGKLVFVFIEFTHKVYLEKLSRRKFRRLFEC